MIKKMLELSAVVCGTVLVSSAFSEKIKVREYNLKTDKVGCKISLLQISDLHSSAYGDNQELLIDKIDEAHPDAIMLTGDIADNRVSNRNAFVLAKYIGKKYRCFYVEGNHEVYTGCSSKIKDRFRSYGITVLEGEKSEIYFGEDRISVCGIDDPYGSPDKKGRIWEEQLEDCSKYSGKNCFSVLLTHRPEPVELYRNTDFDLILAGHAHGGQVIVPGLINGLYAPHQGIFPKYAGGFYDLGGPVMIVSRGLSKHIRPRVFNPPELVTVNIMPKK